MNESTKTLRISWQELFPWTIIFRSLSIASSPTVIALALLGALLNPMGWIVSQKLFLGHISDTKKIDVNDASSGLMTQKPAAVETDIEELEKRTRLMETASLNASVYRGVFDEAARTDGMTLFGIKFNGPRLIFNQMVRRFGSMFHGGYQGREFAYFAVGNIWAILVWSFVGLAIARVCLVRITRNEYIGIDDAFAFATRNWLTAAGSMGIPLAGIALLCIPAGLIGLLMGFDFGVIIAGLIWFVVLALSLGMVLLLLGLALGWPLMVSSVAAESQNAFDAMTRSYAYIFQRPLHYLFYVFVAIVFGGLCWMIVSVVTDGVIDLAYWSVSWGTNLFGAGRMDLIQGYTTNSESISSMVNGGTNLIGMWNALVRSFAVAFIYGLFWCQAATIYLILRKDVDETEMDEIYIEQETRKYELPPLKTDENGIPQIQPLDRASNSQR